MGIYMPAAAINPAQPGATPKKVADVSLAGLKENEASKRKLDRGFFYKLHKAIGSDSFKSVSFVGPLAGIFVAVDALIKKNTFTKRTFMLGLSAILIGFPGIISFLRKKVDSKNNPSEGTKLDLDKDIIWSRDEKVSFRRAFKQFLGHTTSLQQETNNGKEAGTSAGGMMILAGPPGTGKSAIAAGMAASAGKKLITVNISSIKDKWSGEAEKRIKEAFERAHKENAWLFFDEAEAIVPSRTSHNIATHTISMTNAFIQDFNDHQGVVKVILATNSPDQVDDAVKSRSALCYLGAPQLEQRVEILLLKLRKLGLNASDYSRLSTTELSKIQDLMKKHEFTGRDIEAAAKNALHIAEDRLNGTIANASKATGLTAEDIGQALTDIAKEKSKGDENTMRKKIKTLLAG